MASYFFGSDDIRREAKEEVIDIFEDRTGKKPEVYDERVFILSSRNNIDQGRFKVAFNGYILGNDDEPEKYVADMYEQYGKQFVKHLNGQFRGLIFDSQKDIFYLFTDKVGNKVVYHAYMRDKFVSSSHLTPLLKHSSVKSELSLLGVSDFIQGWSASFGGGERLIKGVRRLYPGHYLTYNGMKTTQELFWDNYGEKQNISDQEAVKRMDELLKEGAEKLVEQNKGDLNVFLSGGFDSTFLVALLREVSDRQINTYTWGWEDEHFESGREMSKVYGTRHTEIRNSYEFPTDEELLFYEEPQNAFVRYPFRELYNDYEVRSFWTGLNSQATFPVCLKNIRKLDRMSFASRFFRTIPTTKLKHLAQKKDYRLGKAVEILESDYESTAAVIDWSICQEDAEQLMSGKLEKKSRRLDKFVDERWKLEEKSYQENYNYLQLRLRDTARYAYYAQDFEHYDIYGYQPLVEFSYSLPMSQKKNRRLLQKVAKGRVPDKVITKGASGWEFVSRQFLEIIRRNRTEYKETVGRFIEREFVNRRKAEDILLPEEFRYRGKGLANQMMAVYLLERWIKLFIEEEEFLND